MYNVQASRKRDGGGGPEPQFLEDQLTLSQQGGLGAH